MGIHIPGGKLGNSSLLKFVPWKINWQKASCWFGHFLWENGHWLVVEPTQSIHISQNGSFSWGNGLKKMFQSTTYVGGLKYSSCSLLFGEDLTRQFDEQIFQMAWLNHQPATIFQLICSFAISTYRQKPHLFQIRPAVSSATSQPPPWQWAEQKSCVAIPGQWNQKKKCISGWWFQPIWINISQIGSSPQVGVKVKKCLKPPPSNTDSESA